MMKASRRFGQSVSSLSAVDTVLASSTRVRGRTSREEHLTTAEGRVQHTRMLMTAESLGKQLGKLRASMNLYAAESLRHPGLTRSEVARAKSNKV